MIYRIKYIHRMFSPNFPIVKVQAKRWYGWVTIWEADCKLEQEEKVAGYAHDVINALNKYELWADLLKR